MTSIPGLEHVEHGCEIVGYDNVIRMNIAWAREGASSVGLRGPGPI